MDVLESQQQEWNETSTPSKGGAFNHFSYKSILYFDFSK